MLNTQPLMWVIAGQDSSGGAGIVADLLTAHDLHVTAAVVVTALTAQNSQEIRAIEPCSADFLITQLETISEPAPAAIKIGMLANAEQVYRLAEFLRDLRIKHPAIQIVCDPVLGASSGYQLGDVSVKDALPKLFEVVDLITPNAQELAQLSGLKLDSPAQIVAACRLLYQRYGVKVLAKGGHCEFEKQRCIDLLASDTSQLLLSSPRIATPHSHGTGCTLSSAIAAQLAHGEPLDDAIVLAKAYVSQGLRCARTLGQLPGAVAHEGWPQQLSDFPTIESSLSSLGQAFALREPWPSTPLHAFPRLQGPLGVYPVVDNAAWVTRLLAAGVRTIQLRIKDSSDPNLAQQVAQCVAAARQVDAQLFINDYWQLAIEFGAYGVHLGQDDLADVDLGAIAKAGLRLGISTHGYKELLRAVQLTPSYIALGHVFATTTKQMPSAPQGLERLQRYVKLVSHYPTVAIGGIDLSNAKAVLRTGVQSLAVVRAITQSDSPEQASRTLEMLIRE
ncbi:thiamine phosphate synthase [Celerinatantimonas yamalensis]|uniref:Thiamine-phosphate synthase n=1 Tax=Celerinatantimonas yamalensis TaxID=559956 RepID=A0ABW9G9C1_9GAMM